MTVATLFCLGAFASILSVSSAVSSTAGSTALVDISDINREALVENRVYLNVNNGAETSGTVYSWTYCYSQDNDPPPYELVIAMYRQQQNGVYQLVPGSYRRLKINVSLGQPNSFNCNNIDLQTSEYFAIQRNDVVAVCEPFNVVRIEVLFSDRSTSLKGWNANSCSENTISSSGSVGDISGRYFLLKATINVDECAKGTHTCHENAKCSDVIGGFTCDCNSGFSGDGFVCEDIDECSSKYGPCHEQATCTNVIGSFSCDCITGFTGNGFHCEDIDECSIERRNNICHEQATCFNKPGGFSCKCKAGFMGNGSVCEDIDECLNGSHSCQGSSTCSNGVGSFNCICDGTISTNRNVTMEQIVEAGSTPMIPIVLIAACASSIVTLFVSTMVGLVCVKVWQIKKGRTRNKLNVPPTSGGDSITLNPCLAYGSLETEEIANDGCNQEYYSYAD